MVKDTKMKNKGKLTISRPSYSDGSQKIAISVEDKDAVIGFLSLEISYEDFAAAITGMGMMPCEFEVRGLESVGKKREDIKLEFKVCSGDIAFRERKDVAYKRAQEVAGPEWEASNYFDSQDSFFYKDKNLWARTTAYRWVKK